MHERSQAFVGVCHSAARPSTSALWSPMMELSPLHSGSLPDFLLDAQVLLTQCQECLQHLRLIDNDPDACHCLNNSLGTLAQRAEALGLYEVAHYAAGLQRLLAPCCAQRRLHGEALVAVDACLNLLAWQLELLDSDTGRLNLDNSEQDQLLDQLAGTLACSATQSCASKHAGN